MDCNYDYDDYTCDYCERRMPRPVVVNEDQRRVYCRQYCADRDNYQPPGPSDAGLICPFNLDY